MPFLIFAIVASAVGIAVVLVRNRRPTSMDHSIDAFERGLRALAPEPVPSDLDEPEPGAGAA